MQLANRTAVVKPSSTSKSRVIANELKAAGVRVVNFAAGELDLDACDEIKNAAKKAIDDKCNVYTPTFGLKNLREALAHDISFHTGQSYQPDEVGVTAGAKQALYNAAMVLVNPGDEVIIPQPYWVTFPTQVEVAGGAPVHIDTSITGYHLKAEDVKEKITPRTKALVINSPNNPSGAIYEREELRKIAHLALKYDFWIIFDECYSRLVREGATHQNIVEICPEAKDRIILINSFSKSYAMTGWRLGYVAGPAYVIKAMESLQGHTTSNPSSVAQYAVLSVLQKPHHDFIAEVNQLLQTRMERGLDILSKVPELKVVTPEGGFYFFVDVSSAFGRRLGDVAIQDVSHLCELLLSEAKIAVVSGAAFGEPDRVRLSYAIADDDIEEGLLSLIEFFGKLT